MEHEIRTSLENFTARLRASIDGELDGLAVDLMRGVEAARERARAELDAAVTERVAQARADAAREFEQRESQIRASALTDARQSLQQEFDEARTAREALERETAGAASVQVSEREGRLEAVERLLSSVRRLDAASSLRETLEVLVQSASLETPRVAILLIEGSTVRTFAQRGFSEIPDSGPLAAGGIVDAAVRHAQPASTSDPAGLKAPGFAALDADRAGFAAPLRVGNRTVAVLYADDADGALAAPAAWPEALELLARHASMHLENLTVTRTHAPEVPQGPNAPEEAHGLEPSDAPAVDADGPDEDAARRYAKLLVSEIKLYNESTVRTGREQRDLRSRLRDEIEHAEQTYLARIPETVTARRRYFEEELVQTLAGGDAGALGSAAPS